MPGTPVPKRAYRLEQFGLINGSIHSYPASSINAFWPPRATLRRSYTGGGIVADEAHAHWGRSPPVEFTGKHIYWWGHANRIVPPFPNPLVLNSPRPYGNNCLQSWGGR
jgi:hypothetical protein